MSPAPLSLGSPERAGLPSGDEKRAMVRQMFDDIAGHYDLLNRALSFGMDVGWRRRCISALGLPKGSLILDVACGTGDLCDELERQGLRPVGLDLSFGMLAQGRAKAFARAQRDHKAARVRPAKAQAPLVLADALTGPFRTGSFDGVVSGFALRNVVSLDALFRELARITRPGGRISLLELAEPEVPLLRAGHKLWCTYGVPFVGSLLSDAEAYKYLPRSLSYLPPAAEVVKSLESVGFAAVEHYLLAGGASQLYVATRSQGVAPWS